MLLEAISKIEFFLSQHQPRRGWRPKGISRSLLRRKSPGVNCKKRNPINIGNFFFNFRKK